MRLLSPCSIDKLPPISQQIMWMSGIMKLCSWITGRSYKQYDGPSRQVNDSCACTMPFASFLQ